MAFFYVSDITNSTLNITLNTYSLQDALTPNGPDSTLNTNGWTMPYLFHKSCQYGDAQNCTAVCQDPGSAFSSLDTLHNCMMYPVIADQYSKNNLSLDIVQLAQSLGIEKSKWPSPVSINITNTIGSCLDAYCTTLEGCMTDAQDYNKSYQGEINSTGGIFLDRYSTFYFNLDPWQEGSSFDLCTYLPASVNQDIGGIGVRYVLDMNIGFANCGVGICILLDPNRHQSFGVFDGHLVEMGSILSESQYLRPVARTREGSQASKDSNQGQDRPACCPHISIGGIP